jgi:hypothetical protein
MYFAWVILPVATYAILEAENYYAIYAGNWQRIFIIKSTQSYFIIEIIKNGTLEWINSSPQIFVVYFYTGFLSSGKE